MEGNMIQTITVIAALVGLMIVAALPVISHYLRRKEDNKVYEISINTSAQDDEPEIDLTPYNHPQVIMLAKIGESYECERNSDLKWMLSDKQATKLSTSKIRPILIKDKDGEIAGYITSFSRTRQFFFGQIFLNKKSTNFITMIRRSPNPELGFHIYWEGESNIESVNKHTVIKPSVIEYACINMEEPKVKNIGCPIRTRYNN